MPSLICRGGHARCRRRARRRPCPAGAGRGRGRRSRSSRCRSRTRRRAAPRRRSRRRPRTSATTHRRPPPTRCRGTLTRARRAPEVVGPVVDDAVGHQEHPVRARARSTNSGVVAHEHHRALPRAQRGADRGARRRIEVVGGLVEQQQVVVAGDEHRERELRLLAARERARVLERDLAVQAEHAEQRPEVLVGLGARRSRMCSSTLRPGAMPSCSCA